MLVAALAGKGNLALALAVTFAVFLAALVIAMAARNAGFIEGRGDFFRCDRLAAGMAELVIAFLQTMLDGDAPVEDEAGAFPQTCLLYTSDAADE